MLSVVTNDYCLFMAIVLSHISALEFWESIRIVSFYYRDVLYAKKLIREPLCIAADSSAIPGEVNQPFHCLVAEKELRRFNKDVVCHVWTSPLPKGSVYNIGRGVYACSPELCFVQMARNMSLLQLIKLGYELCGLYTVSEEGLFQAQPLTTVDKLKSFISKAGGVRGTKKASKALQYVRDNSASPMETCLAMLLSLPYRLGGYGFEKLILNHPIQTTELTCGVLLPKTYICDLFWPDAGLAIEYDSDQYHTKSDQIAHDSIKRTDLGVVGIKVISVACPHFLYQPKC
ncbi:MAG: hypothetical protein ACOYD7_08030 [Raoultibacter sp.]|jgi:hypothetical protein